MARNMFDSGAEMIRDDEFADPQRRGRRALLDQMAPDEATAIANRAKVSGPLRGMLDGLNAQPTSSAQRPSANSYGQQGSTLDMVNGVARRGGSGGGGSAASGALSGGALGMTFGGPIGAGIGAVGGAIKNAVSRRASTAPTDFNAGDARNSIAAAYREYLGRDASPQEIETHLRNQGLEQGDRYVGEHGLAGVLSAITNSEEAQRYAAGGAQAPTATTAQPPQGSQQPTSQGPATSASLLAFLKSNYGSDHTPEGLARAFQEHPEMFEGAQIIGSKGDKVQFADGQIHDMILAAGEGGKGWQSLWDNDPNAVQSDPVAEGGQGGMDFMQGQVPMDSSFFQDLMARLSSEVGGIDRSALMSLLGKQ
jgi:hypothetical protein